MPKNNTSPDLSVVILNYNTADLTRTCLTTVLSSRLGRYTIEIIVCDNGSTDGSISMIQKEFPDVTLISSRKNLGFAAGNNSGIRRAKGRFVLLLNTDTEMPPETLGAMIAFMDDHPEAGASTCKILLPDGSMDPACHRGFPTPWVAFTYLTKLERLFPKTKLFGQYHQGYKDVSSVHEVDCIVGAFFFVRRETIAQVGLLDEDYFMYGEDIDWAYRIRAKGWSILFNPKVTILHKKKQSGRSNTQKNKRIVTEVYFHKYNLLFYTKHYAGKYPAVLTFIVRSVYAVRIFFLEKFGI